MYKNYLFLILSAALLMACGEEAEAPKQKAATPSAPAVTEEVAAEKTVPSVDEIVEQKADSPSDAMAEEIMYLPSQVIYQEEIYKNWPYTEAPAKSAGNVVSAVEEKAAEMVEAVKQEVEAVSGGKPYQLVDGVISANVVEGWKTYNGGGCGACHGKGGIGAVGPNLADSVTKKLSKEQFVNIVTNGKSGTMMRPHKTNKRVMDNMDNLYAYLLARGDDVLGPGNLIKLPLGK
jgi:mono/diheme cytochrome c family protein